MIWPRGVSHHTPPGQIARVVPRVYILAAGARAGRGCLERRATRSGDPQQAKNKESDTPFAQWVLGVGRVAFGPPFPQGLRASPSLGKDAGAGGPGLGVFLLCSLMWNVDLSRGPGVGGAHPTSFRLHFCSAPLSCNLETMPVFSPWCFGLT